MRILSLFIAIVLAFTASVATTNAQKGKGKETDKKATKDEKQKEPPPVTDVGGKSLKEWIAAIRSEDRSVGASALRTVLMFGPERAKAAIPEILKELKRHKPPGFSVDPAFLVNAPETLTKILISLKKPDPKEVDETIKTFKALLHDPQIVVRYHVLQVLPYFGPVARETLIDLVELTKKAKSPSYETRKMAVVALSTVAQPFEKGKDPDPKVLNALYAALKPVNEKASQVRMAALNSLLALRVPELAGEKSKFEAALEPVAKSDPEALLRIHALLVLHNLENPKAGAKRPAAIGKLLAKRRAEIAKLLKHKEIAVRMEAARALGLLGKDSHDQLAALIETIDDKEGVVGAAAVLSLANISRKDPPTKKILAQFALTHPTLEVRAEFAKAIGGMAPDTADLIPTLLKVAKGDKEDGVKLAAILAISNFGSEVPANDVTALQAIGADKKQHEAVQQAAKDVAEHILKLKSKDKEKEKDSKKGASK